MKWAVTTKKLLVELVIVNISLVKDIYFAVLRACFKTVIVVSYLCSTNCVTYKKNSVISFTLDLY